MPLISMFPCSTGGASIDYNSRPQIDFDGKWIKPFVEFYDGEPYWEAWFFSSGTLTVNGTYTADAWGMGGGAGGVSGASSTVFAGRGDAGMALGVSLSGSLAVTIGAGGNAARWNTSGGASSLGSLLNIPGGGPNREAYGEPYRFSDPAKQSEAGNDGTGARHGRGGWQFWGEKYIHNESGDGYGAGGGALTSSEAAQGHPGALVIRIKI